MIRISPNEQCMCDSGRKYKKCCRPYHEHKRYPPTPEDLVRARFSAYGMGNVDFIMETTHPDSESVNPKANRWRAELEAYCLRTFFAELNILSAEDNKVSYQAKVLNFGMEEHDYIEHARFEQVDGRWLYLAGDIEDVVVEPEVDETASDESISDDTGETTEES